VKELPALPLSHGVLERCRIAARRQRRPGLLGGHQMRRKGQSLDFKEYRHYLPGDDIRHVDWRASVRHGAETDLLVRQFSAEEQLTLVISLDLRMTMRLPQAMPKVLIALWLAEAISSILLRSGDQVLLHPLFASHNRQVQVIRGRTGSAQVRRHLNNMWTHKPGDGLTLNLDSLQRHLKPTAVWLIISDFYFHPNDGQHLARTLAEAQDGYGWVLTLDLDSWPHERLLLGQGARRIEGPGSGFGFMEPNPVEIDGDGLSRVEREIFLHKEAFRERCMHGGLDALHWEWPPEEEPDAAAFFTEQFQNDKVLKRLFMRESS